MGAIKIDTLSIAIANARAEIEHGCDGPVTSFVLMSRAAALGFKGVYTDEAIANALFESLRDFGFLSASGLDASYG